MKKDDIFPELFVTETIGMVNMNGVDRAPDISDVQDMKSSEGGRGFVMMSEVEDLRKLKVLELENLILSKRFVVMQAEREASIDSWLSDWSILIRELDEEIGVLIKELKGNIK